MSRHGDGSPSVQSGPGSARRTRVDKESPFREGSHKHGISRASHASASKGSISPPQLKRFTASPAVKNRPRARANFTLDELIDRLKLFRKDIGVRFGQLARHSIESNVVVDRRVKFGKDLFAEVSSPTVPPHKEDTLRIKTKEWTAGKHTGTEREEHYNAARIKTLKKPTPLYYSHPIEVEKNVVASQTPMAFYPYKGDTDTAEKQKKQDEYFKELHEVDNHQLGPIKLDQKRGVVIHSERVAQVSIYLDTWLQELAIDGLNKWVLWLCIPLPPAHKPRTDQDIDVIHNRCGYEAPENAIASVIMFAEAWDRVFVEERTRHGILLRKIDLFEVLCRDGEINAALNPRSVARKNSTENQGGAYAAFETKLETYSSLGCLICFKHSCEHGFYTDDNSRERFSLEKGVLTRRLAENLRTMVANNQVASAELNSNSCERRCYLDHQNDRGDTPPSGDWSEAENEVLRAVFVSVASSLNKVDPICHIAALLDRDCVDVHERFEGLSIQLPTTVSSPPIVEIPNLTWYNREKKKLSKRHGADKYHMPNWDHIGRDIDDVCALRGCDHDGPCGPGNKDCPCAAKGQLCEKFCGCTKETCAYKFTGCSCRLQNKSCDVKGEDCICIQLNRECDPDLCGTCGVIERADPLNANDDALHATGCQNCSLQRGVPKKLVLGNSQFHGFGLFAAEDIKKDQFIIEYVGELVSGEEGDRRYIRRQNVFEDSKPLSFNFTLLKECNVWVDGARYGNLSRYVNHAVGASHKCNVTPKILLVNGGFRIAFRAKRTIKAWEELLFDYGKDFGIDSDKEKDKKQGQSHKTARKNAPVGTNTRERSVEESDHMSEVDSDIDEREESVEPFPEPSPRKRKRGLQEDSEEDVYQPPSSIDGIRTGSQDESESGTRPSTRLRQKSKPSPMKRKDFETVRTGKRGRPRKFKPSTVLDPPHAPLGTEEAPESPEPITRPRSKRPRLAEINDSEDEGHEEVVDIRSPSMEQVPAKTVKTEEDNEEEAEVVEQEEQEEEEEEEEGVEAEEEEEESGPLTDEEDEEEEDEDGSSSDSPRRDQPVRDRRTPLKFKDDEIYGLRPKKRRNKKGIVTED